MATRFWPSTLSTVVTTLLSLNIFYNSCISINTVLFFTGDLRKTRQWHARTAFWSPPVCTYYLNQDWTSSSHMRGPRPARGPYMCIYTHVAKKEWFTACSLTGDDLHFRYTIYANKVSILRSAGYIMFFQLYHWSYSGDRIGTETAQSI